MFFTATTEKEKPDLYIQLVDTADKLYTENEMVKIYELLIQHKECDNANILWRLARAARDKGKLVKDKEVQKQCVYEAFQYAERALELDDQNFACHKWYAIMLNYRGEYEGTKKQISNAFLVKTHFLKAIELNPKDATSIHSIGQWCFVFADLAWYERKLAAALFATPPTATYSEALHYFQLAEEVDPFFYSKNLLMIGKTHLRMKNYKLATDFLQKARDYPVKTPDDQEAHDESIKLLNGLGVKTD
ncbi:hypothetical protein FSP39_022606 [Pinctada imbricata]|uniref:Regulator of microtubule dynamics protein 1 n=1 Tax=Pinctada imbricata TaxID=66713 RepID=A0AA88XQA8_PINIB|nr:hypothetical protein FSP39_022606 [Pinctada imbricata]